MSHISGKLTWNNVLIQDYRETSLGLVITLSDDSQRTMNRHNWGSSYFITKDKLFKVKKRSKVKIAAWKDFDPELWFCDVEILVSAPTTEI